MNNLSLFIYLANVTSNFSAILIISLLLVVAILGLNCVHTLTEMTFHDEIQKKFRKPYYISLAVIVFCLLFVPSRETMYLMAASEIGEEAIQTEEFLKLRGILNNELDQLLEGDEE